MVRPSRLEGLEGDVVNELRLLNDLECEVVPLIGLGGLPPVQEVVIVDDAAGKVRLAQDGDVLRMVAVRHRVDEAVTQA